MAKRGIVAGPRHELPELQNMIRFLATQLHWYLQMSQPTHALELIQQIQHEFQQTAMHHAYDHVRKLIPELTSHLFCDSLQINWTHLQQQDEPNTNCNLKPRPYPGKGHNFPLGTERWISLTHPPTGPGVAISIHRPRRLDFDAAIDEFGRELRLLARCVSDPLSLLRTPRSLS